MLILFKIKMDKENFLQKKANFIRDEIIRVCVPNGAGHIASSLSCVDILTVLYYDCMKYDFKNPFWEDRDRLIFSKAHGCYGIYAIMADKGVMPKEEWEKFYLQDKIRLWGCMERDMEYGFEAGCGSLGHGLPMAVGLAFGAKLQKKSYHVFCLVGDGELEEGATWESLQFAVKHDLDNLIIIIDANRLGAMDFLVNILDKTDNDLIKRIEGFGAPATVCPGHDVVKLTECLNKVKADGNGKPKVIVAKTVKGYGLKCMENTPKFHFRLPTEEELKMGKTYDSV